MSTCDDRWHLKVIQRRYLGDESARLRFLREARAAARAAGGPNSNVLGIDTWAEPVKTILRDGVVEGRNAENLIKKKTPPARSDRGNDWHSNARPEQFAGVQGRNPLGPYFAGSRLEDANWTEAIPRRIRRS